MKSVCVYCGSSLGTDPAFLEATKELAAQLAGRGLRRARQRQDDGAEDECAHRRNDTAVPARPSRTSGISEGAGWNTGATAVHIRVRARTKPDVTGV